VSSAYRILCLTHDPATDIAGPDVDDGWTQPEPALAAIADRTHALTAPHAGCDLLLGRYSYPLVEVACPRSVLGFTAQGPSCFHSGPKWVDVAWLRLLWHAAQWPYVSISFTAATEEAGRLCWTPARVHRLRYEIGAIEIPEQAASCCPACDIAAAEAVPRDAVTGLPWER